ncbi:LCP family protein [Cohnella fermenti]|uniref:LytR family transcriptional regulator n=1 Tax=Cohnella fermenti TaxID=2565925 RepID=A0A4S4BKD6_9BACL|nr:LCP family protein [Cohnella fermenti]THF74940.1 LytR family transcriptional regulator [Cohnella fermenti]
MKRFAKLPKKWRLTILIASSAFCLAFLGLASYAGYLYYKASNAIHRMAGPELPAPSATAGGLAAEESAEPSAEAAEAFDRSEHSITFLLAGVDSRSGSGGTLNTDVLMLASLNKITQTATLLSLPRDLQLKPQNLSSHKANYFYAYYYTQDKTTAMANTKQFYSELFDFPIDYMVLVNFDGLRKMVDAVGGITINVDMDMKYRDTADGTDIDLKKGVQHVDGKKALDFVRYRKSNEGTQESSDIDRNARQQQVISQILDKLSSFSGFTQWGKVLDILGNNIRTDVPEDELRSWILNFAEMNPNATTVIPVATSWVNPYIVADETDLENAVDTLRAEAGLPESEQFHAADVVGVAKLHE